MGNIAVTASNPGTSRQTTVQNPNSICITTSAVSGAPGGWRNASGTAVGQGSLSVVGAGGDGAQWTWTPPTVTSNTLLSFVFRTNFDFGEFIQVDITVTAAPPPPPVDVIRPPTAGISISPVGGQPSGMPGAYRITLTGAPQPDINSAITSYRINLNGSTVISTSVDGGTSFSTDVTLTGSPGGLSHSFSGFVQSPDGTSNTPSGNITITTPQVLPTVSFDNLGTIVQQVRETDTASFSVSGNNIQSYEWSVVSGNATVVQPNNTSVGNFVAGSVDYPLHNLEPSSGKQLFGIRCRVRSSTNDFVDTDAHSVFINDSSPPTVELGGTLLGISGVPFQVTAAISDPDVTIQTIEWRVNTDGASAAYTRDPVISGQNGAVLTQTQTTPAIYFYFVRVIDNDGDFYDDFVRVRVTGGSAPIARITGPDTAVTDFRVTIDGRGSTDTGGAILGYRFTQTSGPPVFIQANAASLGNFSFTPSVAGNYVFSLIVEDTSGELSANTAMHSVLVTAPFVPGQTPSTGGYGFEVVNSDGSIQMRFDETFIRIPGQVIPSATSGTAAVTIPANTRASVVPIAEEGSSPVQLASSEAQYDIVGGNLQFSDVDTSIISGFSIFRF